jgi:CSLREA domain-containing protein
MPQRVGSVLAGALAFLAALGLTASPLPAVTITVNSQLDIIDSDDRQCTLREAIIAANTNTASGPGAPQSGECPAGAQGMDDIAFQDPLGSPDVYALAIPPSALNDAQSGDLNVTEDLIINGNGPLSLFQAETIIDGGQLDRVFRIDPGITVTFERLTIRNGAVSDHGAGIANEGTLFLVGSSILGNEATCGLPGCAVRGAGVSNRGSLTVERSVIGDNNAVCSAVTCAANGGGIFNDTGAFLNVSNSVVFFNAARCVKEGCSAQGGGIWNGETLFLVGVVSRNDVSCEADGGNADGGGVCVAEGGGLYSARGVGSINNSLFEGNRVECSKDPALGHDCQARGGGLSIETGQINLSVTSVIENVALCNVGLCEAFGGGIHNRGATFVGGAVSNNLVSCARRTNCEVRGGGLFSDGGVAQVNGTTFSGNLAVSPRLAEGGGASADGGAVLLVNGSTFSLNLAIGTHAVVGGAISSSFGAFLRNSTVSRNSVSCWGPACVLATSGGLRDVRSLGIEFTTVVDNFAVCGSCTPSGGGVTFDAMLSAKESIVADNSPENCLNLGGQLLAFGANLDTDGTCPGFTFPGTNPLLGPLAMNGGPTATHALLTGSPAIDAASDCLDLNGIAVLEDQRFTSRPKGPACDLGAYERFRLLGGGGSTPVPRGLLRDRRATSDRAMCQMLRAFDRGLRSHVRSGALAPEDAAAIHEVSQRFRVGVECPGVRFPRFDTREDRE